jgi:hypothetical protein
MLTLAYLVLLLLLPTAFASAPVASAFAPAVAADTCLPDAAAAAADSIRICSYCCPHLLQLLLLKLAYLMLMVLLSPHASTSAPVARRICSRCCC